MKTFVKKTLLYLIIFTFILFVCGFYFEYQYGQSGYPKAQWLVNLKDKQFDYAVIGSSRVMNMVDINTIDDITTKTGVNLGLGGADYRFNYLSLYLLIEKNNSIEKLFIQVDPFEIYNNITYNVTMTDSYFFSYLKNEEIFDCLVDSHSSMMLQIGDISNTTIITI
ncbi:MAG: hypothetical protein K8R79_01420 [Calditrichales bacterium]|nr:hypothetical protein [Calditrichales bacterium]